MGKSANFEPEIDKIFMRFNAKRDHTLRHEEPKTMSIVLSFKSVFAGFSAALALVAPTWAQTDYGAIEATPALWSISDEDSTVYLFGTVHFLPAELNWATDYVTAALDESEIIYLEADAYSPEAIAAMQALITQIGFNEPGVTLSSLINEQAKADVATLSTMLGAPPELLMTQIDPMKPWFAALNLAFAYIQAQGYSPQSGVEAQLIARYADKPRAYFETAEEQFGYLSSQPLDIQVRDFEVGIRRMLEDPGALTRMAQAWATGDMNEISRVFNEDMRNDSPEMYQTLIILRNNNWIPQIVEALNDDRDAFIAVGAGHMPGESGVIELLRAEGLDVAWLN
jgi:uncharacterized protein YbaP (TraB family)